MSADALPTEEDQPEAAVTEAPETGTSQEAAFEAPFNINDIEDDTVRGEVERYVKQTQGAFTKKTQGLASQRAEYEQAKADAEVWRALQADPALRQQLLNTLAAEAGYQLPEDDTDPVDQLSARQDALEAQLAARAQQDQQQERIAQIGAQADQELGALGDLTDEERELIIGQAASMPARADGFLDIESAHNAVQAAIGAAQKRYRASKKAPHVSRSGVAGQKKVDLSDTDARQEFMASLVDAYTE